MKGSRQPALTLTRNRLATQAGSHFRLCSSQPTFSYATTKTNAIPGRQRQEALLDTLIQDKDLSIKQAVLQGAEALISSSDWSQLQNILATAPARHSAPVNKEHNSSYNGGSGSSPWGFAMRQPVVRPRIAAQAASGNTFQVQQPRPLAPAWNWQAVQQFRVLGLGPIASLAAGQGSASRLGFRLMQLVLAVALHRHMLPGLSSKPLVYDPDFDPGDVALLHSLGFEVAAAEPNHAVPGPTLLYMPCCPRQLYSDVLAANWTQLPQLAILGTSMSSLSNSQSLFTALVEGSTTPLHSQGVTPGLTPSVNTREGKQASQAGGPLQQQPSAQQPMQPWADMVSLAYQQGRVVELLCPDCGAHGVGVSLHLFQPQQTAR